MVFCSVFHTVSMECYRVVLRTVSSISVIHTVVLQFIMYSKHSVVQCAN